jgi:hypothetical protein
MKLTLFSEKVTGTGFPFPVSAVEPLFHGFLAAELLRQSHFGSRDTKHPGKAPVAFVGIYYTDRPAVHRKMTREKSRQGAFAASTPSTKQNGAHGAESPLRWKNTTIITGTLVNSTTTNVNFPSSVYNIFCGEVLTFLSRCFRGIDSTKGDA